MTLATLIIVHDEQIFYGATKKHDFNYQWNIKQSILKASLHKLKYDIDGTNENGSELKGYHVQMSQRTQVHLNSNVINWS